jgi:hypothetical protein
MQQNSHMKLLHPNSAICYYIDQVNGALLNSLGDLPDVPRVLVGSKNDMTEGRQVDAVDAQKLADSWGVR